MTDIFKKLLDSLRQEGVRCTMRRIPRSLLWRYHRARSLLSPSAEDRFTYIYKRNVWGSKESRSGVGSDLSYTANLRHELPTIIDALSIHSIFDAPCGDFNWMKQLLGTVNVRYVGGDIVLPLVQKLQAEYGGSRVSFTHLDITKGAFPRVDMMLCRDCLFHLSYKDTWAFFDRFLESGIKFLLTTTFDNSVGNIVNRDIRTGDFRPIDLTSEPYNLPRNPLRVIEDWQPPHLKRYMNLWSRDQVLQARGPRITAAAGNG